jgi:hypothetical protein
MGLVFVSHLVTSDEGTLHRAGLRLGRGLDAPSRVRPRLGREPSAP